MDERIRNNMIERGHTHLLFTVDDPQLEEKLVVAMETLVRDADEIRDGIGRNVVRNLKLMARMGVYFEQRTSMVYPEFPVRRGIHSWEEYLPALNPALQDLVEKYDTTEALAGSGESVGSSQQASA